MIVVLSTGLRSPHRARCEASVACQRGADFRHIYIEASDHSPPLTALENRWNVIATLDPRDIVVELDGDDELAHHDVLAHIAAIYECPNVWLTYGSFELFDGRPGFCAEYPSDDYRALPWLASHLKTYRAGLAQRLDPACDLKHRNGAWREHARDLAMMLPMLEMAGPEHSRFVPEMLCRYSLVDSWEWTATAAGRAMEQAHVMEIRALPRRERLEAL